jgi:hypothetical protein
LHERAHWIDYEMDFLAVTTSSASWPDTLALLDELRAAWPSIVDAPAVERSDSVRRLVLGRVADPGVVDRHYEIRVRSSRWWTRFTTPAIPESEYFALESPAFSAILGVKSGAEPKRRRPAGTLSPPAATGRPGAEAWLGGAFLRTGFDDVLGNVSAGVEKLRAVPEIENGIAAGEDVIVRTVLPGPEEDSEGRTHVRYERRFAYLPVEIDAEWNEDTGVRSRAWLSIAYGPESTLPVPRAAILVSASSKETSGVKLRVEFRSFWNIAVPATNAPLPRLSLPPTTVVHDVSGAKEVYIEASRTDLWPPHWHSVFVLDGAETAPPVAADHRIGRGDLFTPLLVGEARRPEGSNAWLLGIAGTVLLAAGVLGMRGKARSAANTATQPLRGGS